MSDQVQCGDVNNEVSLFGVRVASVFVILVTSMTGAFFPVLTRKSKIVAVPEIVFEYVIPLILTRSVFHLNSSKT